MSMKALVVDEFGDSSKLKYCEVSKPDPSDGEVLYACKLPSYIFRKGNEKLKSS